MLVDILGNVCERRRTKQWIKYRSLCLERVRGQQFVSCFREKAFDNRRSAGGRTNKGHRGNEAD
jgi:hypothetical protein